MTELDDIYNLDILEQAAAISRTDRLEAPHATAKAHSKLCGSTVTVDIVMDDGRVADFGQKVEACLLGQAAAGIVAKHIVGKTAADMRDVSAQMRAMLKDGGDPPTGIWKELAILKPVRDYPGRHASTMLVFDAVNDAIENAHVHASAEELAR